MSKYSTTKNDYLLLRTGGGKYSEASFADEYKDYKSKLEKYGITILPYGKMETISEFFSTNWYDEEIDEFFENFNEFEAIYNHTESDLTTDLKLSEDTIKIINTNIPLIYLNIDLIKDYIVIDNDLLTDIKLETFLSNIEYIEANKKFAQFDGSVVTYENSGDIVKIIKKKHQLVTICNNNATCIDNYALISSITNPYNDLICISQAIYLRSFRDISDVKLPSHRIPLMEIPLKILEEMKFNFICKFLQFNEINIGSRASIDTKIEARLRNEINAIINENFGNLKVIFIFLRLDGHVNIHLLIPDELNEVYSVYIYEPHMNMNYPHVILCRTIYNENDKCDVLSLPAYVLRQTKLPLCYMYTLHFFMLIIFNMENDIFNNSHNKYDDIFITKFTRDILKLAHEYKHINDIPYYLLTNNTYRISKLIEESKEIDIWYISYISSDAMINFLSEKGVTFIYKGNQLNPNSRANYKNIQSHFFLSDRPNVFVANKLRLLSKSIKLIGNKNTALYMAANFDIPKNEKNFLKFM